jgi:rhodanese-related sulfurtransferase
MGAEAGKDNMKNPPKMVDAAEASKLIADKKVVVLDMRTPAEFAAGHIVGATNLDFRGQDFKAKVAALDKNQPYLVHCAAGGRSAKACDAMEQLDFKTLYDLKGGMNAWTKAGNPVEK